MSDSEGEVTTRRRVKISDDEESEGEQPTMQPIADELKEEQQVEQTEAAEEEKEEDMDDLFGDDDDDEKEEGEGGEGGEEGDEEEGRSNSRRTAEEDDGFIVNDEGDDFLVKEAKQRELREIDLDVIRHPSKFENEDEKLYNAKIPSYLNVETTRFEGQLYLESLISEQNGKSKEQVEMDRLIAENTIRWRYTKDEAGKLVTESNAQIVEWSDGSRSLKLGEEYFDIINTKLNDTFLASFREESGLLVTEGVFTDSMKFVPTSTNSAIHKKLTTAIKSRQVQEKPKTQSVYVTNDPEKEARELEKQQEQLIRERRRKEQKEQKDLESKDFGSGSQTRAERQSYYSGSYKSRDEYDDDDGFLVEDDDEEEAGDEDEDEDEEDDLALERLKRVKEDGASKYSKSPEGDEAEPKDGEEDEDEDAVVKQRKKRRVIDSEDEDEE